MTEDFMHAAKLIEFVMISVNKGNLLLPSFTIAAKTWKAANTRN